MRLCPTTATYRRRLMQPGVPMAGLPPESTAAPASGFDPPRARPRVFYGWWIVAASAGLQLLQGALLGYPFGAYLVVLRSEFGWSTTSLAAASSLREMQNSVLGPIQGSLLQRFGPRRLCQVGIVVFAAGFLL